jgi:6-pyruvoyl-tetrahydropterin synthase
VGFGAGGETPASDATEAPKGADGSPSSTIFLNDVTRIDCAIFDPSKGILGQTWRIDVALTGQMGANGFVFDFSQLKKLARQVLKSSVDHSLVIPINSQAVQYKTAERGECWMMRSKSLKSNELAEWEYKSPPGAVFGARSVAVSRQVVEQEVARTLRHRLPAEITQVVVALREEDVDPTEATFRYTHGISGHEGMCQRLMHGHRCRLQVYVGDERRPDLEHYVARDVLGANVHMATPSQLRGGALPAVGTRGKTAAPVTLGYEAPQGYFEATLPANRIFVVEQETSVECIARELARLVKREESTAEKVRVVCYEGIDKGAIAEA